MKLLSCLRTALCLLGLLAMPAAAAYPEKPINMIIAFTAGGSSDVQARIMQKYWNKYAPQPWVFVYKPGAGGIIGFTEIAKARPDGYTIGGVDLRHIRRSDLRRHIGLVLQEPFLFSQTIGENIRAVRPDAPEDAMRRAAAIACVDDAVTSFPEGYDTIVGERGVTLSGGQKQRVAIARMLMQQAPVMIFDDSLSAVDAETDEKIRTALRRSTGNATVLLISHRVTTLMQADRILVLDGGRVAELGTHAQLVEKPGIYRDIYHIQMQSADRALLEEGGSEHGGH